MNFSNKVLWAIRILLSVSKILFVPRYPVGSFFSFVSLYCLIALLFKRVFSQYYSSNLSHVKKMSFLLLFLIEKRQILVELCDGKTVERALIPF